MAVKRLLKDYKIEVVVEKIIDRFHTPLPNLIDNINNRWNAFFYKSDMWGLNSLKELFYEFTSVILIHIIDEEENWFPLIIKKLNNPEIEMDSKILYKIAWEHYDFDLILDKLEEGFKRINLDKNDDLYDAYINLLNDFAFLQEETKRHLEVEVQLTKEFTEIMKEKGINIEL